MTYWLLNAGFLAAVAILVVAAIATRRAPRWSAVAIAAGVLLVITAIFDNVMIGVGIVAYDPDHTSGINVGLAPIEDFAYAIAAAAVLPALWTMLGSRTQQEAR